MDPIALNPNESFHQNSTLKERNIRQESIINGDTQEKSHQHCLIECGRFH